MPSGSAAGWVTVGDGLAAGEERLPLFPMTYMDRHRRRVLAGTVPVAGRERYEGALPPAPIGDTAHPAAVLAKPGRAELEHVVLGLQALLQLAAAPSIDEPSTTALFREATFFALVDLAAFLADHLPPVWEGVAATGIAGTIVTLSERHRVPSRVGCTELADGAAPSPRQPRRRAGRPRGAPGAGHRGVGRLGRGRPPVPPTGPGRGAVLGLGVVKPDPFGDPASTVVGTVDDPFFLLREAALTEAEAETAAAVTAVTAPPLSPPSRTSGAV